MPIELSGLSEVSEMLSNLTSARVAKGYLTRPAKKAGQVVIDALAKSAPEATGALADHMEMQSRFEGSELHCKIGPTKSVYWGIFSEFGTQTQPATHWMTQAWDACQEDALEAFVNELKRLFEAKKAADLVAQLQAQADEQADIDAGALPGTARKAREAKRAARAAKARATRAARKGK
jgi:HK97 gp10 family phage protein